MWGLWWWYWGWWWREVEEIEAFGRGRPGGVEIGAGEWGGGVGGVVREKGGEWGGR